MKKKKNTPTKVIHFNANNFITADEVKNIESEISSVLGYEVIMNKTFDNPFVRKKIKHFELFRNHFGDYQITIYFDGRYKSRTEWVQSIKKTFRKYGTGLPKFHYDPDVKHALFIMAGQLVEHKLRQPKYDDPYESFSFDAGSGHKLVLEWIKLDAAEYGGHYISFFTNEDYELWLKDNCSE